MPMTPLQTRLHNEVCIPASLPACLCGAYARVGQAFAEEQLKDWPQAMFKAGQLAGEMQQQINAARELQTRLRKALEIVRLSWPGKDGRDKFGLCSGCGLSVRNGCSVICVYGQVRAALSAGAGEK